MARKRWTQEVWYSTETGEPVIREFEVEEDDSDPEPPSSSFLDRLFGRAQEATDDIPA